MRSGVPAEPGQHNQVEVELQKYQENEDDWDDVFGEQAEGATLGKYSDHPRSSMA